jgi:hypothetical protein
MFHPVDISAPVGDAGDVRTFSGDGTPYLRVPGLKEVKSVRVGATLLPQTLPVTLPVNPQLTQFAHADLPMVQLVANQAGEEILLRNQMSNDGVWQAGAAVSVGGVWGKG